MSLNDVLIDEMRDLYSAENQQLKASKKMLKEISDSKLKQLLTEHVEQTKEQVVRLRQVFEHLGKKPTGKHCSGMEGCIKEITEALEEDEEDALKDAGIIGATLRTEHYEIAGYSAALAMAKTLKNVEIVQLLTETLREEQSAARGILSSSIAVLKQAASQKDGDQGDKKKKDPKEKRSEQQSEQDEKEAAPILEGKPAPKKRAKSTK